MWPRSGRSRRLTLSVALATVLGSTTYPQLVRAAGNDSAQSNSAASSNDSANTPVRSCVDAHLLAQSARQDGRLLESRTRLLQCAMDACPELVRGECARLLDELRTQIPTVIFRVTVDGETRSNVAAWVGERKLFDEIPARATEFDPGKYHFRFEFENFKPIERDLTIAEGERFLPIAVAFESPKPQAASATDASRDDSNAPVNASADKLGSARPVPWPVYGLAGLGVVGLGGFVGLALATKSKENDLQASCSPLCSASEVDAVQRRALYADISLGLGATAFASALTYYLLRPTEKVRLGATVSPKGRFHTEIEIKF